MKILKGEEIPEGRYGNQLSINSHRAFWENLERKCEEEKREETEGVTWESRGMTGEKMKSFLRKRITKEARNEVYTRFNGDSSSLAQSQWIVRLPKGKLIEIFRDYLSTNALSSDGDPITPESVLHHETTLN